MQVALRFRIETKYKHGIRIAYATYCRSVFVRCISKDGEGVTTATTKVTLFYFFKIFTPIL